MPRLAAFEVVKAVRVDDAYANLVLPHVLREHALTGRDAAFVTELASGTLRQSGTYDAILADCVDRPLAKVEAKVLDLLRLGAHQLLSMRVPDHAAISTTVDLVKSKVGPGAASFANAVLRKVSRRTLEEWIAAVAPDRATDPVGHDSVAYSHPPWVVDALAEALDAAGEGGRGSEIEALLAADNEPPRVTLVARPGRVGRDELLGQVVGEPTPYSPYGVVLTGGSPAEVTAVAEGRAGVQDEGSQLVAIALADAPVSPGDGADPDRWWLDLCAGPGGKSALLAALAAGRDAILVANERQPHRAGLVRFHLAGAEGTAGVVAADGIRPPFRAGAFDRVLVDAPCTGLGALRRRPEARWRRAPSDLAELVPLQRSLLASALDLARPGGVVLYSTCSPLLEETKGVVEAVLAVRDDAELVDAGGLLPDLPDAAGPLPGTLQLWPHRHGTDAMFLALLRKR